MPGISEGEISSRAGTPAFETAATAGIPLAIAEEEQE